MRIVVDASFLTHRAGPGRYLRGLLSGLVVAGREHQFVVAAEPGAPVPEAPNVRWEPITFGAGSQAGRFLWREVWLPALARRERADLVFSPMFFAPMLSRPAKSVVTVLDLVHELYPKTLPRFRRLYFAGLVRRSARRADHVLTLSENSKRDIVNRIGIAPERITPTLLAAGPNFDRSAALARLDRVKRRYGLPSSYILYMGTFEPRKNVRTLLKAYRMMLDRGQCAMPLILAGEHGWGKENPSLQAQELGVMNHVRFTGYIEDSDQPAIYAGAELLVFPSLYEGFGLPPLEAMACGTPVVASNAASIPEVVGDAAVLVDPKDPEALAEAIEQVLGDRNLRDRLREAGLERSRGFTWEATARSTLRGFEAAMSVPREGVSEK